MQPLTIINSADGKIGLFGVEIRDVSLNQFIYSEASTIMMISCFFSNITSSNVASFISVHNSNLMTIFQNIHVQNSQMFFFVDFVNISRYTLITNSVFSNSNCKINL